jgi:F-type H+-transporting ATPase subunit epsilon
VKTCTLLLQDATRAETFEGVGVFVGEDGSGSFNILAGHGRIMTTLVMGLARFRRGTDDWQYLAMPGAVLYFYNDTLTLSTRRYLRDDDYSRISSALQEQLLAEEEELQLTRESLHRMEASLLKRLWQMGRQAG